MIYSVEIIEFRFSLKCVRKVESKKVCLHLNKQIETIYKQIRMGKSLTTEEMKRMLKKEIEKSKKHTSYFSYVGVDRSKEETGVFRDIMETKSTNE